MVYEIMERGGCELGVDLKGWKLGSGPDKCCPQSFTLVSPHFCVHTPFCLFSVCLLKKVLLGSSHLLCSLSRTLTLKLQIFLFVKNLRKCCCNIQIFFLFYFSDMVPIRLCFFYLQPAELLLLSTESEIMFKYFIYLMDLVLVFVRNRKHFSLS